MEERRELVKTARQAARRLTRTSCAVDVFGNDRDDYTSMLYLAALEVASQVESADTPEHYQKRVVWNVGKNWRRAQCRAERRFQVEDVDPDYLAVEPTADPGARIDAADQLAVLADKLTPEEMRLVAVLGAVDGSVSAAYESYSSGVSLRTFQRRVQAFRQRAKRIVDAAFWKS